MNLNNHVLRIYKALGRPDHPFWVLIQQVAVRGLIAFKFLLAASLLGPEKIGLVGIAMLTVAIAESLSETGLSQAVVQLDSKINPQVAGAIWSLQMTRGIAIFILLLLLGLPITALFKIAASEGLVLLAAVIPFLRSALNPGIFLVQRDRNFRHLAIYEAVATIFDFFVTLITIYLGFGAASILLGNIASDCVKLVLSWTFFKIALHPTFHWRLLRELTHYGKWIWGSSVVTLALNQLDKVLVARYLGATEFGLYQMASRISQLVVADGSVALGQYLFPTFSKAYRASPRAVRDYLSWIMRRLVPLTAVIALLLALTAGILINVSLSDEWSAAVPILRAFTVPMFLGAVMAILAAYLRGCGTPKFVTQATLIQLLVLMVAAPILLHYFDAVGMASSLGIAGAAAAAYMLHKIYMKQ